MNELQSMIHRYGVSVQLICNGEQTATKGFMMPLRRRHMMYLSHDIFAGEPAAWWSDYYLYIGPGDVPIEDKTLIERDGWVYEIISSEKVETETVSYTWAVLKQIHKITTEVV